MSTWRTHAHPSQSCPGITCPQSSIVAAYAAPRDPTKVRTPRQSVPHSPPLPLTRIGGAARATSAHVSSCDSSFAPRRSVVAFASVERLSPR